MNVIYEDSSILVVDKPAGIPVQTAGVAAKSLETECKKYRKMHGEKPEIYVVHRLDQPVSGIILFAKTKEAAAALSEDMQSENLLKDYRAKVYSVNPLKDRDRLVNYLIKDSKNNIARIVKEGTDGSKRAELDYEVTGRNGAETDLIIHLHTGRFHQIRCQLAGINAPILGDLKYGSKDSIEYSKAAGIKSVCLEAYHIMFRHPDTKKIMEFEK